MTSVGFMEMPADFRYREIFLKGKPRHERTDPFSARHPKMECLRRAKIFLPFDALKGFPEAVSAKEVLYEEKKELSEEAAEELSRRLSLLRALTKNSREVRERPVYVTVTYYEPCTDPQHESMGKAGLSRTKTGICRNVDPELTGTLMLDDCRIPLKDLLRIDSVQQNREEGQL